MFQEQSKWCLKIHQIFAQRNHKITFFCYFNPIHHTPNAYWIILSQNCFSPIFFLSLRPASHSAFYFIREDPDVVYAPCLFYQLPKDETIISHEIFWSENKNIIGTSIFITMKNLLE